MLNELHEAMDLLPTLLQSREGWHSIDVAYHAPRVERIWRQWGGNRISLHRIYPCDPGDSLYHPHPWPSAIRVVDGEYEHKIGYLPDTRMVAGDLRPVSLVTEVLRGGSEYALERGTWHSVRPLSVPSNSIMVSGPPYPGKVKMPHLPINKQGALSEERFEELFFYWRAQFDD